MEIFKNWATSVITAAAITCILSFIVPSGPFVKSIKTITAIFMLICFVTPLTKTRSAVDVDFGVTGVSIWLEDSKLENEVKKEIIQILKNEIKLKIEAYFNDSVDVISVDSDIEIDFENDIKIKNITIELQSGTDIVGVRDYVYEQFGVRPQIKFRTGEYNG